jgi:hypothetical protein
LLFKVTGTIWSLNTPVCEARSARLWLSTASLVLVFAGDAPFGAMFSAVTPMWMLWKGSCSAPIIMSTILVSPMRAPQRMFRLAKGTRLMFSATAANRHVGVAQQNRLAGVHDGLQPRAAQAVDVERRVCLRRSRR